MHNTQPEGAEWGIRAKEREELRGGERSGGEVRRDEWRGGEVGGLRVEGRGRSGKGGGDGKRH